MFQTIFQNKQRKDFSATYLRNALKIVHYSQENVYA